MKRLAVAALVFAGIALPLCAQRGGARGGGSPGRAAPAVRSSPMSARGFPGTPSFAGNRPPSFAGSTTIRMSPANRPPGSGAYGVRHGYPIANRPRRGYGVYSYGYGIGIPYAVPLWGGWGDSGVPPYGDSSAYADQGAVAPDSPKEYAGGPPDQGQTVPPGPYVLPYQAVPPVSMRPAAPLPEEEAVTLVFSDGRAPEQIHNYALTRTTLLVMDGRRREIPLDQLDLVETAKVNREAGVEFRLVDAGR